MADAEGLYQDIEPEEEAAAVAQAPDALGVHLPMQLTHGSDMLLTCPSWQSCMCCVAALIWNLRGPHVAPSSD